MSPSRKPDRGPVHTAHVFSRLVAESEDGRAVYACSANARCGETEVRRKGQPSPFGIKHGKRGATAS
jgi:hypothetical protein